MARYQIIYHLKGMAAGSIDAANDQEAVLQLKRIVQRQMRAGHLAADVKVGLENPDGEAVFVPVLAEEFAKTSPLDLD